ncbi:MAG: nucleoside hydrolase [Micropruina sp.]
MPATASSAPTWTTPSRSLTASGNRFSTCGPSGPCSATRRAAEGRAAARSLLASLRSELPVRRGSEEPLDGRRGYWRSILDAPSQDPAVYRLSGPGPPRRGGAAALGADPLPGLIEDLEDAGEDVILACLGPLTNVARLIRDAPEALAGVRSIHLMGGCLGMGELVDTNFAVDPGAARLVLGAGIPLTVVPLDVTRTTEPPGPGGAPSATSATPTWTSSAPGWSPGWRTATGHDLWTACGCTTWSCWRRSPNPAW